MNPYGRDTFQTGMMSQGDRLIGLRDELEWLLARVSEERPVAVSLVGPWGVGKSFLLTYLANPQGARRAFARALGPRFRDDPQALLFVMLDLEGRAGEPLAGGQLLDLLFEQTLAELAGLLQIPDARTLPLDRRHFGRPTSVAALRALVQRELTSAREEADDDELRERFDAAIGRAQPGRLIELLRRADGWGIRVVFLVDEFDSAAAQLDRADFDHLRALLAVASMALTTRKALSDVVPAEAQTSSFFGLVERLTLVSLYFFSPDEARRMIVEPPTWFPETAGFRFSPADVEFILDMAGLHPDLIRATCEQLYMWTRRRQPAVGADVIPPEERHAVRVRLRMAFADHFVALWRRLKSDEQALLSAIAAGEGDEGVAARPTPERVLDRLIGRGYVVCDRGRYRIFAGLFRDYVLGQAATLPAAPSARRGASLAGLDLTEMERQLLDLLSAKPGEPIDRDLIVQTLY